MSTAATTSRFRPERLPLPAQFWKSELAPHRVSRPSRGWARTTCPLHHGDNPTAFSVNLNTGAFYCHACGAKGDMLSYVMQRDHVDFKTAAMSLGAWDDNAQAADVRRELATRQQERERIDRATAALAAAEHELWIECRDRIHDCDRVLAGPGLWDEAQWQRAQAASILRDDYLLPAYTVLSWAVIPERTRYVLADEQARAAMTAAVRLAGGVRTETGYWMEVPA